MTIACSMSPSDTSTMSSTSRLTIARVSSPGSLTAMPSASVALAVGISTPLKSAYIDGNWSVCTPMIEIPGFSARAAVAMPEMSPPPPMATQRQSSSGRCLSISIAIVPCPAMTSASS